MSASTRSFPPAPISTAAFSHSDVPPPLSSPSPTLIYLSSSPPSRPSLVKSPLAFSSSTSPLHGALTLFSKSDSTLPLFLPSPLPRPLSSIASLTDQVSSELDLTQP